MLRIVIPSSIKYRVRQIHDERYYFWSSYAYLLINDSRIFWIIIDNKDEEKLRAFKQSHDDAMMPWGMISVNKDMWNRISTNDLVFFSKKNDKISFVGSVSKKEINKTLGTKLWKDTPKNRSMIYFLYFSEIKEVSILFTKMTRYFGIHRVYQAIPGMYEQLDSKYRKKLINEIPKQKPRIKSLKPVLIPIDFDGAPKSINETITRFIRDTKKTKILKMRYQDKCQVCGYRLVIDKNKFYSEVHHIHPLKDGGADNYSNMLVLCPTHHAEFDYKVIGIDKDGKNVIDKDGNKIMKLNINPDHKISIGSIRQQFNGMRSK